MGGKGSGPPPRQLSKGLNPLERECMDLLAQGYSEKEAAAALGITRAAVAGRLKNARAVYKAKTTLHLYVLLQNRRAA